ncbi:DUF3299 domain-containing protein [Amphritea sp. 1_MG-2023]|uniref:DUF3299 domain-containing protein n=1 Tax=Amphritea sp. 1_MG-2023 TaxID=3062670 RepID=UPI0026E35EB5|nr:DUF3299 domain-containing protein [Amphritea sp. 1_MG-2023]MDO6564324.1 DUF3299 domain-containing protein [Amphritea sp. 1_MG-2023]
MRRLIVFITTLILTGMLQAASINGKTVIDTEWDSLMPADYSFDAIFDTSQFGNLDDYDPMAEIKFKAMMQALSSAPIVPEMDGKMIRIPGFVVPLVEEGMAVTEFFLVPYFGACIHVPPPPSNQMIHVTFEPGTNVENLYDAVWISGELKVATVAHQLGTSGYTMEAYQIEPYTEE